MARKPLQGIRVVDLGWVWSGPYGCMLLAHLGADVIRIESSLRPCLLRILPPWPEGKRMPAEYGGGTFTNNNLGKRSIALDLKMPAGLEAARRLIATSDIVINNYAAGVIERLGLGYDELKKVKDDIILLCLSGMGDTGPYRDFVVYGQGQASMSGFARFTGMQGSLPRNSGFVLADPVAGVHGAFAALAALRHRIKIGKGQFVDMSQWEATLQLVGEHVLGYQLSGHEPQPNGNRHLQMAPYGLFRCRDEEGEPGKPLDMWVSIAVADEGQWTGLCAALKRPELATDSRFSTLASRQINEDALEALVSAWARTRRADDATRTLQAAGVSAFTSTTHRGVYEDPNLNARGFFVEVDHAAYGTHRYPGIPWRMQNAPTSVERAAPLLGQHTDEVLAEIGYSAGEVEGLRQAGALK